MKWWTCWVCSRGFIHARYLARHLMDVHGEPRPATPDERH